MQWTSFRPWEELTASFPNVPSDCFALIAHSTGSIQPHEQKQGVYGSGKPGKVKKNSGNFVKWYQKSGNFSRCNIKIIDF